MKKIKVSELTGAALDWAVAKCEGMTHVKPMPMTDEEAEKLSVPFYLWGTTSNRDKKGNWSTTIEKVEVVRYGINQEVGATAPSITAIGEDGIKFYGTVNMFFGSEAEAESSILYENSPYQWDEGGFLPSSDWAQGGPIIEREKIQLTPHCMVNPLHGWSAAFRSFDEDDDVYALHRMRGKTPLLAAMRCYVASKLGDTVEVPEELL